MARKDLRAKGISAFDAVTNGEMLQHEIKTGELSASLVDSLERKMATLEETRRLIEGYGRKGSLPQERVDSMLKQIDSLEKDIKDWKEEKKMPDWVFEHVVKRSEEVGNMLERGSVGYMMEQLARDVGEIDALYSARSGLLLSDEGRARVEARKKLEETEKLLGDYGNRVKRLAQNKTLLASTDRVEDKIFDAVAGDVRYSGKPWTELLAEDIRGEVRDYYTLQIARQVPAELVKGRSVQAVGAWAKNVMPAKMEGGAAQVAIAERLSGAIERERREEPAETIGMEERISLQSAKVRIATKRFNSAEEEVKSAEKELEGSARSLEDASGKLNPKLKGLEDRIREGREGGRSEKELKELYEQQASVRMELDASIERHDKAARKLEDAVKVRDSLAKSLDQEQSAMRKLRRKARVAAKAGEAQGGNSDAKAATSDSDRQIEDDIAVWRRAPGAEAIYSSVKGRNAGLRGEKLLDELWIEWAKKMHSPQLDALRAGGEARDVARMQVWRETLIREIRTTEGFTKGGLDLSDEDKVRIGRFVMSGSTDSLNEIVMSYLRALSAAEGRKRTGEGAGAPMPPPMAIQE